MGYAVLCQGGGESRASGVAPGAAYAARDSAVAAAA